MTRTKWGVITSVLITIYGALLLFQASWPGWGIVQEGSVLTVAKIVGGVVLIGWGVFFFLIKGQR